MKIVNDKIEISADDIAEFSAEVRKSLVWRAGEQRTAHEYFSARFNAIVEEAVYQHGQDQLEKAKDVFLVFAKADTQTQDSVKRVLGLLDTAEPEATPTPSLLSKVANFFTGSK